MKFTKPIVVICLFLLFASSTHAQSNANAILRGVYGKLQKAKDYSVQANIKVDIPFIRILPVKVKIYYKQKDKFKVESKSIALVPRQGFDQIAKILADSSTYISILQGDEKTGTTLTSIVNVIPTSDTSDIVLGKLWIDKANHVVLKSQLTTRSNGTIETEYIYGSQIEFGLPDKMIFLVDIKKFKVPKKFTADMNKTTATKEVKGNENKKGKIYITLSNYQVNKGIPDSIFKK